MVTQIALILLLVEHISLGYRNLHIINLFMHGYSEIVNFRSTSLGNDTLYVRVSK